MTHTKARSAERQTHQLLQPPATASLQSQPVALALTEELKDRNLQLAGWKFYDKDRDPSNRPVLSGWHHLSNVGQLEPEQQGSLLESFGDEFRKAKRARSKATRQQDKRVEAGLNSLRLLGIAQKCVDDERFYLPVQPDFRGRYYPRVSFLSYQSGDTGRALLEFADAYPVDDRTNNTSPSIWPTALVRTNRVLKSALNGSSNTSQKSGQSH